MSKKKWLALVPAMLLLLAFFVFEVWRTFPRKADAVFLDPMPQTIVCMRTMPVVENEEPALHTVYSPVLTQDDSAYQELLDILRTSQYRRSYGLLVATPGLSYRVNYNSTVTILL